MSRLPHRLSVFLFFLALLYCQCFYGVAQTHIGPSLTACTSKIAYDKGTLDAELIGRIIARKKEEMKKELMHNDLFVKLDFDIKITEYLSELGKGK